MNDNEDEEITKKLQQVQEFSLAQEGLAVGSDVKGLEVKVQELQHALFQRQHTDFQKINESVKELRRSSRRVEVLTGGLIGLTLVLSVLTALDVLF